MQVTKTRVMGLVGAGAMVGLGVAGVLTSGVTDDGAVAGSDHSPSTTQFNQPSVPDMNGGATATWAPPGTTASSASAAPTVKAG